MRVGYCAKVAGAVLAFAAALFFMFGVMLVVGMWCDDSCSDERNRDDVAGVTGRLHWEAYLVTSWVALALAAGLLLLASAGCVGSPAGSRPATDTSQHGDWWLGLSPAEAATRSAAPYFVGAALAVPLLAVMP